MTQWIVLHTWIISWALLFGSFFCTNIFYMSIAVPMYLREELTLAGVVIDLLSFLIVPIVFLSAISGHRFYYTILIMVSLWYLFSIRLLIKAARDMCWSRHLIGKLPWKYVDRVLWINKDGKERLLFVMRNGCIYEHHHYYHGWSLVRPNISGDTSGARVIKKKSAAALMKLRIFSGKSDIDKRKII